jgi:hypothetical protein
MTKILFPFVEYQPHLFVTSTDRKSFESNNSTMKTCLLFITLSLLSGNCSAFVGINKQHRPQTLINAENPSSPNRRDAVLGIAAIFSSSALPEVASAKYSDFSRREQDWQARNDKGDVTYSSARQLKAQLQEIAPMNSSSSKIFCPNGPSANVSPLMENKCGDRLATPSVFGRQDDMVGNSIPGFKTGYFSEGGSLSTSAQVGGFPSYK